MYVFVFILLYEFVCNAVCSRFHISNPIVVLFVSEKNNWQPSSCLQNKIILVGCHLDVCVCVCVRMHGIYLLVDYDFCNNFPLHSIFFYEKLSFICLFTYIFIHFRLCLFLSLSLPLSLFRCLSLFFFFYWTCYTTWVIMLSAFCSFSNLIKSWKHK